MIKLFALRKFTPKGETREIQYSKFLKDYDTLEQVLEKRELILANAVDKDGDYNLFLTLGHYKKGEKKKSKEFFEKQNYLGFDIDGIDTEKAEEYLPLFTKATGLDYKKCVCIMSGNGLHIAAKIETGINAYEDFEKYSGYYYAWCELIDKEITEAGLDGESDGQFYQPSRMLRFPGGRNIKPYDTAPIGDSKDIKLLNGVLEFQDWDFFLIEPLKTARDKDKYLKKNSYGKPDKEEILKQCPFLIWAKDNQEKVSEPQWFSVLSITGSLGDNFETSHLYSKNHPTYTFHDTQEKAQRITNEHGPVKCDTVSKCFEGCDTCPHRGKISSPIQLKGKDHIATSECGFTLTTAKGGYVRKPADLQRHFLKEHFYVINEENEVLFIFDGKKYKECKKIEVKTYAQKMYANPECDKDVERVEFLNQVKVSAKRVDSSFFMNPQGLINLSNGVLDIKSRTLRPHTPEYGFLYVLDYEFDISAECPTWDKLLATLTENDKDSVAILEEYLGYIISGMDYRFNKMLLLAGDGNNGKTTLINAFRAMVGKDNYSNVSSKNFTKSFHISSLFGKLANFSEETNKDAFRETEVVKELTGDGEITAEKKYQDTFSFRNHAKLVFAYNEAPYIGERSEGMQRRLLIVPFNVDLGKNPSLKIKNIKEKIDAEKSGVLNRALDGLIRLLENEDFTHSSIGEKAKRDVVKNSDAVLELMEDHIEKTKNEKDIVAYTDLWDYFKNSVDVQPDHLRKLTYKSFCYRVKRYADSHKIGLKRDANARYLVAIKLTEYQGAY